MAAIAGVALGVAFWLLLRPAGRLAPADIGLSTGADTQIGTAATDDTPLVHKLRPVLSGIAGIGGWLLVGGSFGIPAGIVAGVAMWWVVGRIEDPAIARREQALESDLPTAIDLLGACVASGASVEGGLLRVARAMEGPIAEEFTLIHAQLEMGVDPVGVWFAIEGALAPLGRAIGRAYESGAPVRQALAFLADDLRSMAGAEVEAKARSVQVKAAAPLGLCLLPAFIVLGIIPMVVGMFMSITLPTP